MLLPAEPETYFLHVWPAEDHPGRIEIENRPIKILDLWSFDIGGQVFAYRVSFAREAIQNGVRTELGASSTVFFYDLDGSGKFALMRWAGVGVASYLPSPVPEWVTAKK